jgi:hypothetical protein
MDYAQVLLKDGVVVIPAFNTDDLQLYNTAFWKCVNEFPEYQDNTQIKVLGAFGALGNPASFHNPVVRHIRINMMTRAINLFSPFTTLAGCKEKNLEQLIDRMSIRKQGTTLGKETWHRDQANSPLGDMIFGGWVNLDLTNEQRFSCIPGSHLSSIDERETGFARETQVDESQKRIYQIPPGYCIVFFQNILHEVLPGKVKTDSIRLYLGWRLTDSTTPLYNHEIAIRDQGVPSNLPGGGAITMFAPNHLSFHAQNTITWSQNTFKPQCLEQKNTLKLGQFTVVHRTMRSLREYNLPLYLEYTQEELSVLQPAKEWTICGMNLKL